jgi:hypothetical protein
MTSAEFEPAILGTERLQTYGIGTFVLGAAI